MSGVILWDKMSFIIRTKKALSGRNDKSAAKKSKVLPEAYAAAEIARQKTRVAPYIMAK